MRNAIVRYLSALGSRNQRVATVITVDDLCTGDAVVVIGSTVFLFAYGTPVLNATDPLLYPTCKTLPWYSTVLYCVVVVFLSQQVCWGGGSVCVRVRQEVCRTIAIQLYSSRDHTRRPGYLPLPPLAVRQPLYLSRTQ